MEAWKQPIAEIFKRYGYTEFQGPERAIGNKGKGPNGEHLAVSKKGDRFHLYVRRGGEAAVRQVAMAVTGGTIERSALIFRELDLAELDELMGRVVRRLRVLG